MEKSTGSVSHESWWKDVAGTYHRLHITRSLVVVKPPIGLQWCFEASSLAFWPLPSWLFATRSYSRG